jgi:hypothetical protein
VCLCTTDSSLAGKHLRQKIWAAEAAAADMVTIPGLQLGSDAVLQHSKACVAAENAHQSLVCVKQRGTAPQDSLCANSIVHRHGAEIKTAAAARADRGTQQVWSLPYLWEVL